MKSNQANPSTPTELPYAPAASALARLQAWYASQCDGDWEHSSGIRIESCDNPGWWVKINLFGTHLTDCAFPEILEGVDAQRHPVEARWICCLVEDNAWHGAGDATTLERLIEVFLDWADTHER